MTAIFTCVCFGQHVHMRVNAAAESRVNYNCFAFVIKATALCKDESLVYSKHNISQTIYHNILQDVAASDLLSYST